MLPHRLPTVTNVTPSDNERLMKWRVERGALVFPDWSKGEIVLGGKDDVRKDLRNEIYELIVS